MNYISDVWSALSQLINAICGGMPCETVSGRAHRSQGRARLIINRVFFWQRDHCKLSHQSDMFDARWLVATGQLSQLSKEAVTD
jgi:hypothetical protein